MSRFWKVLPLLGLVLLSPQIVQGATLHNSGSDLFSDDPSLDYLCPAQITQRSPSLCPPYSPGARKTRMEYLRSRLPNPLPELPIEEIEVPADSITNYTFAYVRPLPAAVYRHPEEAAAGLPPVREFLSGDNWVSVIGQVEYNGEVWYEINAEEFVKAEHIALSNPSRFHGVVLSEPPAYPFGWINRNVNPAPVPGGEPRADIVLQRYETITIFAQEQVGQTMWYMVGTDQWIDQSFTSRVDVDPIPEGVAADEKWIEVNTYEQTLAAYVGPRMVFATLVSSGRGSNWTPDGLTRIWAKLPTTPMINRDVGPDSPAWYYLEDVEWTQYFNGAYALHTAYWHNSFSFTRSHGCVNLSVLDAKWLYGWTTPFAPEDVPTVYSEDEGANAGTWVWIHKTPPIPEAVTSD